MEKKWNINVRHNVFCESKREFDTQNEDLLRTKREQITREKEINETGMDAEFGEVFNYRTRLTSRSANLLFLLLRTDSFNVLFCGVIFLMLFGCVSGREQRFAIEPQDQVKFYAYFVAKISTNKVSL